MARQAKIWGLPRGLSVPRRRRSFLRWAAFGWRGMSATGGGLAVARCAGSCCSGPLAQSFSAGQERSEGPQVMLS